MATNNFPKSDNQIDTNTGFIWRTIVEIRSFPEKLGQVVVLFAVRDVASRTQMPKICNAQAGAHLLNRDTINSNGRTKTEGNLETHKNKMDGDKLSLTIYAMIVLSAVFADVITYDKTNTYHPEFFSYVVGLVGYFGIYMQAQRIIDNNSFRHFAFVGLAILVVGIIKQTLTGFDVFPLYAAALPLLFVGYFRLLTSLFYKSYPNTKTKPTVVFATKFQAYFDGQEEGYKPTMRERVFSMLLFLGFWLFNFGFIWFVSRILIGQ